MAIKAQRWIGVFFLLLGIVVLSMISQIGGIILLLSWLFCRFFIKRFRALATTLIFIILYTTATFVVVPHLAPSFGRVALPCQSQDNHYQAAHPLYCWLNRNYVTQDTKKLLEALANHMNDFAPGTVTLYLDAGLPFFDKVPLLPHLSHHDGRKIDIAFYYQDVAGNALADKTRSPIGYWGYEQPRPEDPQPCLGFKGFNLRWDFDLLQPLWPHMIFDLKRNQEAIRWLVNEGQHYRVSKILLEPHLQKRLEMSHDRLRFQGCRAARHDDHFHIEIGVK